MILAIDTGTTESGYCVYVHTNKANGKRYVGVTGRDPLVRWNNGYGYILNKPFYADIQLYGWDNFDHEIVHYAKTLEEGYAKEREYIALYDATNPEKGYNTLYGGKYGKQMPPRLKKRISEAEKGKKLTEEHKRKIGLAQMGEKNHQFGKKQSEETKQKRREWNLAHSVGKRFPSHKVAQFTIDGELVRVWESMGEIKRELGIRSCMISDCCRGKQKTSRGYVWCYWQ